MGFQIPPTFCISSLKKNPAENYGFPDPANFLHQPAPSKRIHQKIMGLQIPPTFCISQLSQKESGRKLWVFRSRQLSASASSLKKNPAENYGFPDPANFLHQPALSKRIQRKIMGFQIPPTFCMSKPPQKESWPAPSKRIWWKIMGLQIPPTFCISQLSQKESSGKLWGSRSRQLSVSASSLKK